MVIKSESVMEIRTMRKEGLHSATKDSIQEQMLIYMLFENKVLIDSGFMKTYGITACSIDATGKVEGDIMCDVSCLFDQAKEIFDRVCDNIVIPGNMSEFIAQALEEISREL